MGPFASFVDRSRLDSAVEDYRDGVLVEPPIDMSSERLYPIRLAATTGKWGDRLTRDPDYVWSEEKFLKAEDTDSTGYFMEAVLHGMAKVQRLLKRSDREFKTFVTMMSEWFRDVPSLLQLWREVWAAGTLGPPTLGQNTVSLVPSYPTPGPIGFFPIGF